MDQQFFNSEDQHRGSF